MCGDDQSIPLEADMWGDSAAEGAVGGVIGAVWVVEFYELDEAEFAVGRAALVGEDLVRCWYVAFAGMGFRPLVDGGFVFMRRWVCYGGISPSLPEAGVRSR